MLPVHIQAPVAIRAFRNLKRIEPYVPEKPTTITIEPTTVDQAAEFKGRTGVEIVDDPKVISRADEWMTAWNQIWHY